MAKGKPSFEERKFDGVRRTLVRRNDSKFAVTKKMKSFHDAIIVWGIPYP